MTSTAKKAAPPEGMVRYCPDCGSIGEVPAGARDCCPDGSHAIYVPAIVQPAGAIDPRMTAEQFAQQFAALRDGDRLYSEDAVRALVREIISLQTQLSIRTKAFRAGQALCGEAASAIDGLQEGAAPVADALEAAITIVEQYARDPRDCVQRLQAWLPGAVAVR